MIQSTTARVRLAAITFAGVGLLASSGAAHAQDAAETAIILGGTGAGQKRAQDSLGASVGSAIGRAANAIPSRNRSQPSVRTGVPRRSSGAVRGKFSIALPADVDPLENANVETHALSNGASIKVSGGLRKPVAPAPEQGDQDEQ